MPLHYAEFDTTQTNLLADLRTHILTSTDWTRPNATGKPSLYKATTTRGAEMIFDLEDSALDTYRMNMAVWRTHDGTAGTGQSLRWLYWRPSAGASTNPLHCIVSVSKEHVFISVEGPRANESGAVNSTYGSERNYFWMSDVVPYFGSDTVPVVAAGGQMASTTYASVSNGSHELNVSRNAAGLTTWPKAKLLTPSFPSVYGSETVNATRSAKADNQVYLFPYVVFEDADGMRGRLSSFFFAGLSHSDSDVTPPAIGSKVQYQGSWYKLLAVSKGNGSSSSSSIVNWGQFGAALNTSSNPFRSPIVAVPCLP